MMRWTLVLLVCLALVTALPGNGVHAEEEPCVVIEEDGRVYVSPPDCVPPDDGSNDGSTG